MLDIIFIILFFLVPFLLIKVGNSIDIRIFTISIPSFLIIAMFAYAYIGIFPLYFGWDEYRLQYVSDKYLLLQVFTYSSISIFSLLMGFAFAKYTLKLPIENHLTIRPLYKKELMIIIPLVAFCFFVLMVYISKVPKVAFLVALTGDIKEAHLARSMMGNDFAGKYHWYNVIMHHLFNLLTFALYSAYLVSKKKKILLLFVITFLGSAFAAIMSTEKGPFAWLLIGLFLTYCVTKLNKKMPKKILFKLVVVLLSFLVLLYLFFMGSNSITEALTNVFSRAFAGSIDGAYHYLEFFPEHQDFLLGRTFPNPGGILPFVPFSHAVAVNYFVHPELYELGIVGNMNAVFWTEAYADFGFLGVLIVPFFVGIVIYSIEYISNKLENTPLKVGFYIWLILHYKNLAITGFSGYFIDFYLVVICFFVIFTISIANKFKIKYYKSKRI